MTSVRLGFVTCSVTCVATPLTLSATVDAVFFNVFSTSTTGLLAAKNALSRRLRFRLRPFLLLKAMKFCPCLQRCDPPLMGSVTLKARVECSAILQSEGQNGAQGALLSRPTLIGAFSCFQNTCVALKTRVWSNLANLIMRQGVALLRRVWKPEALPPTPTPQSHAVTVLCAQIGMLRDLWSHNCTEGNLTAG